MALSFFFGFCLLLSLYFVLSISHFLKSALHDSTAVAGASFAIFPQRRCVLTNGNQSKAPQLTLVAWGSRYSDKVPRWTLIPTPRIVESVVVECTNSRHASRIGRLFLVLPSFLPFYVLPLTCSLFLNTQRPVPAVFYSVER